MGSNWVRTAVMLCLGAVLGLQAWGADFGKVTSRKIADGVYLFTTTGYGDVGLCGNSVAVLSDEGVLVFDSGGTPKTAATVIGELRKLTDKPVRYLVNSHWHWDHWYGNQAYAEAFPGLQIVSHEKNLEQMTKVEPRWNAKGLSEELPGYLSYLEKMLEKAKTEHAPEAKIRKIQEMLDTDRDFVEQKRTVKKTYPNVTFSDAMTVRMGGQEIQILHARGITVGDTYIYLPKEKVLVTGDLLLSPYPYSIGGTYPADWLAALKKLDALEPAVIAPGHGELENDRAFLASNIVVFEDVIRQVREAKAKGLTLKQTNEAVGNQSSELATKMGIHDAGIAQEFKDYFLSMFVRRAYEEMDHALGDEPDWE